MPERHVAIQNIHPHLNLLPEGEDFAHLLLLERAGVREKD